MSKPHRPRQHGYLQPLVIAGFLTASAAFADSKGGDWGYDNGTTPASKSGTTAPGSGTAKPHQANSLFGRGQTHHNPDYVETPAELKADPAGALGAPQSGSRAPGGEASEGNAAPSKTGTTHGAQPAGKNGATSGPSKTAANKAGAKGAPAKSTGPKAKPVSAAELGSAAGAVQDWVELYELSAPHPLDDDQKNQVKSALATKLTTPRKGEVTEITNFWPSVKQRIQKDPDQKALFASLFRALLRFEEHMKGAPSADVALINDMLGPERIAVPGDPCLTEDAIDAYADMTVFLYEQAHPGKTVDGIDNRTLMATVICDKFKDAPTEKDKRAVNNFALTWTKFKVQWANAGEDDRASLLAKISSKETSGAAPKVHDALLDDIFTHGPWK